jgi:hypothetical protein
MRSTERSPSSPPELSTRPRQKSLAERAAAALSWETEAERQWAGRYVTPSVTPMIHTNQGNNRSATVRPFHVEWLKK